MATACYRLEFGVVVGRRQSHEDYTVLFRRGMQMRVSEQPVASGDPAFALHPDTWGGSVADWLACWTRAQKGPGFKSQPRRCRVTVLGKLFTPIEPLFTKQQNW